MVELPGLNLYRTSQGKSLYVVAAVRTTQATGAGTLPRITEQIQGPWHGNQPGIYIHILRYPQILASSRFKPEKPIPVHTRVTDWEPGFYSQIETPRDVRNAVSILLTSCLYNTVASNGRVSATLEELLCTVESGYKLPLTTVP